MPAYTTLIKRQAAEIAAAAAAEALPVKPATSLEEFLQLPHLPGARVLDKLTGKEGTVLSGTIKHTILPTS